MFSCLLHHGRRAVCLLALLLPVAPALGAPRIAAASDLKFALEEIARTYQQDTGRTLKLSFGSSGIFTTQIRNGAPFELFLSADEDYVQQLAQAGLTRDGGVLYAIGRIVLIAPAGSPLAVDAQLKGLAARLNTGQLGRFAIANPTHAPYGRRAEEALRHAGLWDALQSKLVLGENVSQAAQFATSGGAEGGIVALSLAKSPQMTAIGRYALIPAAWHSPLKQRMVLLKHASPEAQAFYRYLQQAPARAVMRRYGFTLPGDGA